MRTHSAKRNNGTLSKEFNETHCSKALKISEGNVRL